MGTQQLPFLEDVSLLATSTSQANCTCAAESAPAVAVSDAANMEGSWRRQKREVQRITETSLLLFYRWRPQILRQKMLSQVRWTSQPKSSLLLLQGTATYPPVCSLFLLQPCSCSSHCSTITTGLTLKAHSLAKSCSLSCPGFAFCQIRILKNRERNQRLR